LSERYEQALAGGFLLTIDWINPRPTLKPYSRFCRAGDCSQRGAAADPSLDSPSATRSSRLIPQTVIDVNENGETRPTYTSLYAPQFGHPWPLVQSHAFHPWPSFALSRIAYMDVDT